VAFVFTSVNDNGMSARENYQLCASVHPNWNKKKEFNDAVGMDADEEEVEPVAGKRVRKETGLASGKLDKDEPGAKLKKRTRVLVEVMGDDIMVFYRLTTFSYIYILNFTYSTSNSLLINNLQLLVRMLAHRILLW